MTEKSSLQPPVVQSPRMQVMLLAAGQSSRLGVLGQALPKPLVPICGYPAIAYPLTLCRAAGLLDVVVNSHHLADRIRAELGDGRRWGVTIRQSHERELLGTGGGLAHARSLFSSEPVLIMNGKVVAELDLRALLAAHAASGAAATMVVRNDPDLNAFAPVEVDDAGRVVGLRGMRAPQAPARVARRMFAGIHIVESALLDRLPVRGVSDVIAHAYLPALQAGAFINSFTMTGYFEEHSTPERYLAGNLALLRDPGLLSQPPGPLTGVDAAARVHEHAKIEGPCRIEAGAVIEDGAHVGPGVVIGRGARVGSGSRLTSTVVWAGAAVNGVYDRAVLSGTS